MVETMSELWLENMNELVTFWLSFVYKDLNAVIESFVAFGDRYIAFLAISSCISKDKFEAK